MKRIALVVLFGALVAGCNQQATADLAVCKSDLAKAETTKTADDAKIAELTALVAKYELAAADAAAAAAKVDAAKAKSAAKTAEAKAVTKEAVKGGATVVQQPIQQITDPEAKAKAKR